MGLFKSAGRRVEEFRQTAKKAAEESEDYRCRSCETRLNTCPDECPECGATTIVPTNTEE